MSLVEYLYIDQNRLDIYVGQIEGGLISYDKVPIYSADISLTGPKAGTIRQRFPRVKTPHEKIEVLRNYLKKKEKLNTLSSPFGEDTFLAHKVIISPNELVSDLDGYRKIAIWMGDKVGDKGLVYNYFIEDYPGYDKKEKTISAFSALYFIFKEIKLDLTIEWNEQTDPDLSPIEFFKEIGALVSPPRWVKSLYRIRIQGGLLGALIPSIGSFFASATIAYPIYIADAQPPSTTE